MSAAARGHGADRRLARMSVCAVCMPRRAAPRGDVRCVSSRCLVLLIVWRLSYVSNIELFCKASCRSGRGPRGFLG